MTRRPGVEIQSNVARILGLQKIAVSLTLVKRNNKLNGKSSKGRRLQWKKAEIESIPEFD